MIVSIAMLCLCFSFQLEGGPRFTHSDDPIVLRAEKWINGPALMHPDTRTYVVLFFKTERTPDTPEVSLGELKSVVERLNKLSGARRDLLVLALTPEAEKQIARFLAEFKPRFAVGVQSASYRGLNVRQFPSVVVLRHSTDDAAPSYWLLPNLEAVEEIPAVLGPTADVGEPGPEETPTEGLMDRLRTDPYRQMGSLHETLETLRLRMAPEAFMAFCDEIEYLPGIYANWLGHVRYQKHLADPAVPVKQPSSTPAAAALERWRATQADLAWKPYQQFMESLEHAGAAAPDEVVATFRAHRTDDSNDLLIRHRLTRSLGSRRDPRLLDVLHTMYEEESDPLIKVHIIMAIGANAPPGDSATRDYLEGKLEHEPNIRWVRPALEMVINQLREGRNAD